MEKSRSDYSWFFEVCSKAKDNELVRQKTNLTIDDEEDQTVAEEDEFAVEIIDHRPVIYVNANNFLFNITK